MKGNKLISEKRRRYFRIARGILATAVLLLAAVTYYTWYRFSATAPGLTDQESGHIYALNANGLTVYLTRAQQFRLYGFAVATAACLAGTVALDAFGKKESD